MTHRTAWPQCRRRASGPGYGAGRREKLTQQTPRPPASAKKLAQQATKRPYLAILCTLGECFRAIAIDSRHWANFVAPMLLTAPRDETVDTNTETSGRLHETHDSFVRQNCAENGDIWLAMVPSVSPKTEHTPAKAMTVSPESPTEPVAVAVAGPGCGARGRWRGPAGLRAAAPRPRLLTTRPGGRSAR